MTSSLPRQSQAKLEYNLSYGPVYKQESSGLGLDKYAGYGVAAWSCLSTSGEVGQMTSFLTCQSQAKLEELNLSYGSVFRQESSGIGLDKYAGYGVAARSCYLEECNQGKASICRSFSV